MGFLLFILAIIAIYAIGKFSKLKKQREIQPAKPVLGTKSRNISKPQAESREGLAVRWIPPNESITIGDMTIACGMFYLGQASRASQIARSTNCIVDPNLRIANRTSLGDKLGQSMPYWPSYLEIDPRARRIYLDWLASGRSDPSVGIGFVFLFFYGLERRFFVDQANQDAKMIEGEVRRLLTIYGENHSFKTYATQFLDAIMLLAELPKGRPPLATNLRSGYAIPTRVRLYLGIRLSQEDPFDAEDALLWLLSLPDYGLRTPAIRCFDEFVMLWKQRFAQRWPTGYVFAPPTARFKFQYHGASGIDAAIDVTGDKVSIPDVAEASAHLPPLKDLATACTDALDSYSRLLGRRPEAKGTLEATLLLPAEIRTTADGSLARSAISSLEATFGERPLILISVEALFNHLQIARPTDGKITAAVEKQIGALLDSLDIGFEPDSRYGTAHLVADGQTLLFKAKGGATIDPKGASYAFSRIAIEAAALAAWTDGQPGLEEFNAIKNAAHSSGELQKADRARLLAYAGLLIRKSPAYSSVIAKVGKLNPAQKRQIGTISVAAVVADHDASPKEVQYLERLYKTFGIGASELYAALHRRPDLQDEPVTVMPGEPDRGSPIPKQPGPPPTVVINDARLHKAREETSAVSAMLSQIFVEDEHPASGPPAAEADAGSTFPGLDRQHADLLEAVITADGLKKSDFDAKARELQLLPDGALETINEWGFETFEEPVLEDEDMIKVAAHLREQIQQLGAEA